MPVKYGKDDIDISANAGEQFLIVLPNPVGGYELHVHIEDIKKVRLLNQHPHPSEIGGGTEEFTFQAIQAGETLIHFEQKRPWEAEPDTTYQFSIHIIKPN